MRLGTLVLSATLFLAFLEVADCNAQILGSRFRSHRATNDVVAPPLLFQPAGHVGVNVPQDLSAKPVFPVEDYYTPRRPKISRILDGPMTYKHRIPAEVDARYTGGFHQTHYQNDGGIPNGDIGIRGNAYKWRTW